MPQPHKSKYQKFVARAQACAVATSVLLGGCTSDGLQGVVTSSNDKASSDKALGAKAPLATASAFGTTTDSTAVSWSPFAPSEPVPIRSRKVIEHPTLADVMQPGPLPEMALGRADAPVTVVKYASLTCPYCRRFMIETFPEFKRAYIDTGKVRFVLREFPIGFQSGAATIALRCAPPEKYFALYEKFMLNQAAWVSMEVRHDPIFAIVASSGLKREAFDACYQNQDLISSLNAVKERGRTLGVIGTPNFFVGDQLIKKVPTYAELSALIDAKLAGPRLQPVALAQ